MESAQWKASAQESEHICCPKKERFNAFQGGQRCHWNWTGNRLWLASMTHKNHNSIHFAATAAVSDHWSLKRIGKSHRFQLGQRMQLSYLHWLSCQWLDRYFHGFALHHLTHSEVRLNDWQVPMLSNSCKNMVS